MGNKKVANMKGGPKRSLRAGLLALNAVAAALVLLVGTAPFIASLIYQNQVEITEPVGFLLIRDNGQWHTGASAVAKNLNDSTELKILWSAAFAAMMLGGMLYIASAVCCCVKPPLAVYMSPLNFTLVAAAHFCMIMRILQLFRKEFLRSGPRASLTYKIEWTGYVCVAALLVSLVASLLTILLLPCDGCCCCCRRKTKSAESSISSHNEAVRNHLSSRQSVGGKSSFNILRSTLKRNENSSETSQKQGRQSSSKRHSSTHHRGKAQNGPKNHEPNAFDSNNSLGANLSDESVQRLLDATDPKRRFIRLHSASAASLTDVKPLSPTNLQMTGSCRSLNSPPRVRPRYRDRDWSG